MKGLKIWLLTLFQMKNYACKSFREVGIRACRYNRFSRSSSGICKKQYLRNSTKSRILTEVRKWNFGCTSPNIASAPCGKNFLLARLRNSILRYECGKQVFPRARRLRPERSEGGMSASGNTYFRTSVVYYFS